MNAPFQPEHLDRLDGLLEQADAVVTMSDVFEGARDQRVIGLRHDVDNVIEPAVEFAAWEAERGYRSTYYVLHTAPYWADKGLLRESLATIAEYGHEIGIHNNALAESARTGRNPVDILGEAVAELRSYGHTVTGTVAHGDPGCYRDGQVWFVNDELFTECQRPQFGNLDLRPVPLWTFGLAYDANWLGRGNYLSDSGGNWSQPFDDVSDGFPFAGQLHLLVHPDWWIQAFEKVPA